MKPAPPGTSRVWGRTSASFWWSARSGDVALSLGSPLRDGETMRAGSRRGCEAVHTSGETSELGGWLGLAFAEPISADSSQARTPGAGWVDPTRGMRVATFVVLYPKDGGFDCHASYSFRALDWPGQRARGGRRSRLSQPRRHLGARRDRGASPGAGALRRRDPGRRWRRPGPTGKAATAQPAPFARPSTHARGPRGRIAGGRCEGCPVGGGRGRGPAGTAGPDRAACRRAALAGPGVGRKRCGARSRRRRDRHQPGDAGCPHPRETRRGLACHGADCGRDRAPARR